ncbi:hypothetical protein D9M71_660580 [compost metagenome]
MVGVVCPRHPKLASGTDDGIAQGMFCRVYGDLERTTDTPPFGLAQLVVFQGHELSPHVGPAPSRAALCFPAIVIGWRAPNVDHAIY